jgi:hypothetical protein
MAPNPGEAHGRSDEHRDGGDRQRGACAEGDDRKRDPTAEQDALHYAEAEEDPRGVKRFEPVGPVHSLS